MRASNFIQPADTFGMLMEDDGHNHKMASTGSKANHKMALMGGKANYKKTELFPQAYD